MIVLKEAFRYQNYLQSLFTHALAFLVKENFITTTTENHNRTKVNPDAQDEKIKKPKLDNVSFTPMDLVNFIVKVIDEKQKLSNAIVVAKKTASIDIDSAMAMNKTKQEFIHVLQYMSQVKDREIEREGTSYKFNNDGDQVVYRYPVTEVTKIDYNRKDIRGLISKYKKQTDEISSQRDLIDVTTEVYYDPVWEVDTPLEDIIGID